MLLKKPINDDYSALAEKIETNPKALKFKAALIAKISEVEKKIPGHAKNVTIQEFNKLAAENIAARLKLANFVSKTDFDNKLMSFNSKITPNKAKYLEVQKKLNSLTTKHYKFS